MKTIGWGAAGAMALALAAGGVLPASAATSATTAATTSGATSTTASAGVRALPASRRGGGDAPAITGVSAWHALPSHRADRVARVDRGRAHRATPPAAAVSTQRLIIRAVQHAPETSEVPAKEYTVSGIALAGRDRSWARAELVPVRRDRLDPATVLLHRRAGSWRIVDLGTAEVGCGSAPTSILGALRLRCG